MQHSLHHHPGCGAWTDGMRQAWVRPLPQRCAQPLGPVSRAWVFRRNGKRAALAKRVPTVRTERHTLLCRASSNPGSDEVHLCRMC